MDAELGVSLLLRAMELEEDAQIFQRWIQQAQYSVSFEDFKASLCRPAPKPTAEVLEDVGNILEAFEAGR